MVYLALVLIWYAAMSATTLAAFALDKRAARRARRRTPERVLHALELLGGWPGAHAGVYLVRHKNRKRSYIALLWAIALVHGAAWGGAAWLMGPPA